MGIMKNFTTHAPTGWTIAADAASLFPGPQQAIGAVMGVKRTAQLVKNFSETIFNKITIASAKREIEQNNKQLQKDIFSYHDEIEKLEQDFIDNLFEEEPGDAAITIETKYDELAEATQKRVQHSVALNDPIKQKIKQLEERNVQLKQERAPLKTEVRKNLSRLVPIWGSFVSGWNLSRVVIDFRKALQKAAKNG